MHKLLVTLHRWLGLSTALFLAVAGLTGAVIAWDHELDEWLNPQLFEARSGAAAAMSPLELADRLEREDPRLRVGYVPLELEPGQALGLWVAPRVDPSTGAPYALGFDQVALDPATGEVQGRRLWGEASLDREHIMPFLYKLHFTLHLPEVGGFALGVVFMGAIALVWAIDALIALWIAFPSRASFFKSFQFRFRAGGPRLVFDLHRSGGVWVWPLLLVLAVSGVSMNLNREVMRPLVSLFAELSPSPFADREAAPEPIEPRLGRREVVELAKLEAARRGITAPPGAVFYSPEWGVYGVGFYELGKDHGDGGLGNPWLYFEGQGGSPAGAEVPGTGSAGDLFLQAQFPLHSGRILGLPGRILVSFLGAVTAMLSVTGVLLWARRQRARAWAKRRAAPRAPRPSFQPQIDPAE